MMQYSTLWIKKLCIHSPSDGPLGCFCLFAIKTVLWWTSGTCVLVYMLLLFLGRNLELPLLDSKYVHNQLQWTVYIPLQYECNHLYSIPHPHDSFLAKSNRLNQIPKEKVLRRIYNLLNKAHTIYSTREAAVQ